MSKKKEQPVETTQDQAPLTLAQKMRNNLNETARKAHASLTGKDKAKAGEYKEIARSMAVGDKLMQIDHWLPMGPWHTRCTTGDFPLGHFTVLLGLSNSGKTTAMMEAAVSCQKLGGLVYLIDSERKFSFERFTLMGGVPEDLITISTTSLEDAWNAILNTIKTIAKFREEQDPEMKVPVLIMWDSMAASIASKLLEQIAGKDSVGVEARINNMNLRKVKVGLEKYAIGMISICHHYWTVPKTPKEIPKLVIKGGGETEWLATNILYFKKGAKITRSVGDVKERIGVSSRVEPYKCHAGSNTQEVEIHVVAKGILSSDEELKAYRAEIR